MAFCWPIQVYIEDTDFGGIVYYVNYLKFMERARTELLRAAGWSQVELRAQGTLFVVSDVEIQYKQPALLDDQLIVSSEVQPAGGAKVHFVQKIQRASDQQLLCESQVSVVCVQTESLRPKRWPKALIQSIKDNLPDTWVEQE